MASFGFETGTFNFDPQAFARSLYNTIESCQGTVGRRASKLVASPEGEANGDIGENPINTFYRILGMPAIRDEKNLTIEGVPLQDAIITKRLEQRILNQGGTLNYFSSLPGTNTADALRQLDLRNTVLTDELDPVEFNKLVTDPLPISLNVPTKRKAPIFPLVVDASIPIYPQSKRIAPLFNIDDYIVSGGNRRLSRPFLEQIIYMRTKVYSGGASTSANQSGSSQPHTKVEDQLAANIAEYVPKSGPNNTTPRKTLTKDLGNFKVFELKIIEKFVQTLKAMAIDYEKKRRQALELGEKVVYSPVPSRRARNLAGSISKPKDNDFVSKVDGQIAKIETELNKIDLFLMTLPSEEVAEADRIRRIGQGIQTTNISSDLLVADFNNLLTSERTSLKQSLNSIKEDRARSIREFEGVRERLMFYTGEGVGLSIFDVLCVLFALFSVDISYLFGLINADAQKRILNSDVFFRSSLTVKFDRLFDTDTVESKLAPEGKKSVGESLIAVEAKIKENFDLINAFITEAKASGESTANLGK